MRCHGTNDRKILQHYFQTPKVCCHCVHKLKIYKFMRFYTSDCDATEDTNSLRYGAVNCY